MHEKVLTKKTGRKYGLLYGESRHPTHLFFTANKYNYSSGLGLLIHPRDVEGFSALENMSTDHFSGLVSD